MNYDFKKDLEFGKLAETHFANWLKDRGYTVKMNHGSYTQLRKFDISAHLPHRNGSVCASYTFEVKYDAMSKLTSNLAFETHQLINGDYVQSGFLVTEAYYWVHYVMNPNIFFIIKTEKLKRFIREPEAFNCKPHRFTLMGDKESYNMVRCLGYLVKKKTILPFVRENGMVFEYEPRRVKHGGYSVSGVVTPYSKCYQN